MKKVSSFSKNDDDADNEEEGEGATSFLTSNTFFTRGSLFFMKYSAGTF